MAMMTYKAQIGSSYELPIFIYKIKNLLTM